MHTSNRAIFLLVFIGLVTILIPAQSMEPQKKIINSYITKSFSKSQCGALYMVVASWVVACEMTVKRVLWSKKEDVSDSGKDFVHATLQEYGVAQDKINAIKIKNNDCCGGWEAMCGYMGVPDLYMWSLFYFKRHQLGDVNREINVSKASVLHEYGHIINKDTLRLGIGVIIAPPIAYGLLEVPYRVVRTCPSIRLSPERKIAGELLRIGVAFFMASELVSGYVKYREHKADMVVVQLCRNADMLQDEGEWYLKRHKESPFFKISDPLCQKWYTNNVFFRELYYRLKMPKDTHLSDLTRSENFLYAAELLCRRQLEKADIPQKE